MNLKDLEGILGNTKSLKRNNKELEEILIVPSMFPCRFDAQDSAIVDSTHTPNRAIGFRLKFRGADGKPITEPFPRNGSQSDWLGYVQSNESNLELHPKVATQANVRRGHRTALIYFPGEVPNMMQFMPIPELRP
jgi:hypothetical protein